MFNWMSKKIKKNNKGFTLVELVVVIAILGILAAIAVPRFTVSRKNAAVAAHNANVRTLESAANMYLVDGNSNVEWPEDDSWKDYLQEWPDIPDLVKNDLNNDSTTYENYTVDNKDGEITVKPWYVKLSEVEEDGKIKIKIKIVEKNEQE